MRPALPRRAGSASLVSLIADAEAGDAGVEHFDALAARCGPQRSEETVGYHSVVGHRWSCSGAWATGGLQSRRARLQTLANACNAYHSETPMGKGFMRPLLMGEN